MDMKEINGMSVADLKDEEKRLRKDMVDIRFQLGTRQLVDTDSKRRAQKDLARVMTALKAKSSAA
jgi:ribosomal protein L29